MTITVQAPTAPANTFTASPDETIRILKALALRQLPSDELRRACDMAGDLGFGGRMSDLTNRGLVRRWTTKAGTPRTTFWGPGWEITQEGRKHLAAALMAAADVTTGGQKPDDHHDAKQAVAAPQVREIPHLREKPAIDPALAVLKAIAARPDALDRDVARVVYSPNEREAAYVQLRVRGLIRKLPMPLVPITYQVTDAGRAHLQALEPQPCRALVVRGCVALVTLPSSAVSSTVV